MIPRVRATVVLTAVPAGKVANWSISTTLIGKADRCAIHARRGTLSSGRGDRLQLGRLSR
jgi:hypothetical protein